jgi:hypothetical protein
MNVLTIIAAPALDRHGESLPGLFDARLGDRLLVHASRQPFLDGCRALLELGYPGDAIAVMRHAGSDTDCLRAKIGGAARLTVKTAGNGRPIFALDGGREGAAATTTAPNQNCDPRAVAAPETELAS